jgi:hypothetical protein
MNRRELFTFLGIGAATTVLPSIALSEGREPNPFDSYTDEQKETLRKMLPVLDGLLRNQQVKQELAKKGKCVDYAEVRKIRHQIETMV